MMGFGRALIPGLWGTSPQATNTTPNSPPVQTTPAGGAPLSPAVATQTFGHYADILEAGHAALDIGRLWRPGRVIGAGDVIGDRDLALEADDITKRAARGISDDSKNTGDQLDMSKDEQAQLRALLSNPDNLPEHGTHTVGRFSVTVMLDDVNAVPNSSSTVSVGKSWTGTHDQSTTRRTDNEVGAEVGGEFGIGIAKAGAKGTWAHKEGEDSHRGSGSTTATTQGTTKSSEEQMARIKLQIVDTSTGRSIVTYVKSKRAVHLTAPHQ